MLRTPKFLIAAVLVAMILLYLWFSFSQKGEQSTFLQTNILIGERHGILEQQLEVTELLREISKSDKKIGVVIEMISADQAELLTTFRQISPNSSADLGYAIGWSQTGWPDYHFYAPIFDVIWNSSMTLIPGDPSQKKQNRWRRNGESQIRTKGNP